jgi:tetratricopeptide (TPR) repeat protein
MNILKRVVGLQVILKRPDRALTKCRDQIKKAPSAEPRIRMLMSGIYSGQKKYSEAEKQIKKVLKLDPDSVTPYVGLAELYYKRGRIEEGIEELKHAVNRKPDAAQPKMMIATFYRTKEDYDTALKWYERIADEHPHFILGLNSLAYLYAERYPTQENLNRALKLLTEIPEGFLNAPTLDTLGWVYYQRKDYDKAIETLERAESATENPIVQLHLGLAYLKANQMVQARGALEKALKDDGSGLPKEDKQLAEGALKTLEG